MNDFGPEHERHRSKWADAITADLGIEHCYNNMLLPPWELLQRNDIHLRIIHAIEGKLGEKLSGT